MAISLDASPQSGPPENLQRIRRISRPLTILLSFALALMITFTLIQVGVLVLFDSLGAPAAYASFQTAPALAIGAMDSPPANAVAIAGLSAYQRLSVAALMLLCSACGAVMLLQLRGLFSLYARGVIFAPESVKRMKGFGLWLVVTGIAANISGRIFTAVVHVPTDGIANAALSVIYGAMIFVIAYVLELAREADLERKEFI